MWYQRDSIQPKDLKRPRNEIHQTGEDPFGPSLSKRAKTVQGSKVQATWSSSWHKQDDCGEGSLPFSDADLSSPMTPILTNPATNPATSLSSQQRHQQSPGQQSSEGIFQANQQQGSHVGYHGMNSILGSLHLSRRRQKASEAGVHQHSAQHIESSVSNHDAQREGLQNRPTHHHPMQSTSHDFRLAA